MIRQITLFQFLADSDDAVVDLFEDALGTMVAAIPTIRHASYGRDLGWAPGNLDYALVLDFESLDALHDYKQHEQHQLFIVNHKSAAVSSSVRLQYELAE